MPSQKPNAEQVRPGQQSLSSSHLPLPFSQLQIDDKEECGMKLRSPLHAAKSSGIDVALGRLKIAIILKRSVRFINTPCFIFMYNIYFTILNFHIELQ
jgi:hypothetical protein